MKTAFASEQQDVHEHGQHRDFGQVDEMIERRDHRKAERVDTAAIVEQVDVVALLPARQLRPDLVARVFDAREHLVGKRPRSRGIRVERRAAPSVDRELDVASGEPLSLQAIGRQQQLDVRIPRGDERQVAVVVRKGVDDDRAKRRSAGVARAERAAGMKDAPLFGEERRDFFVEVPVARSLLGRRWRRQILRQIECESAHELAVGPVELDRRRDRS